MNKVKDKLTGRQYEIHGVNENGKPVTVYASNEVDGILHLTMMESGTRRQAFLDLNEMIECLGLLKYGDEFMDALRKAKHAKKDPEDGQI